MGSTKASSQTFTLVIVMREEFTFQSKYDEDIWDLMVYFLEGLKKRSKYVIARRTTELQVKLGLFKPKVADHRDQ